MYLLDINVLLGYAYKRHTSHSAVARWIRHIERTQPEERFATCSIVELGFIRIASGKSGLAENLAAARDDLQITKKILQPQMLGDELGGNRLPDWVTQAKHTTDGHLLELAKAHNAQFATLDTGIPGAVLIPDDSDPWSGVRDEPAVPYGMEVDDESELIYDENTGTRRLTRCKITGHLVVARRQGKPLVTTEDIKRLLEDFP
jgi:predicted nucleic acid-binding protein